VDTKPQKYLYKLVKIKLFFFTKSLPSLPGNCQPTIKSRLKPKERQWQTDHTVTEK